MIDMSEDALHDARSALIEAFDDFFHIIDSHIINIDNLYDDKVKIKEELLKCYEGRLRQRDDPGLKFLNTLRCGAESERQFCQDCYDTITDLCS